MRDGNEPGPPAAAGRGVARRPCRDEDLPFLARLYLKGASRDPAMAAAVSDRLWEISDIARLVEGAEAVPRALGPHKNRVA
jgi:hypothetical protein